MKNETKTEARWKPINFGWKYWNYAIIGVGLIVGFAVWALPNNWADPEVVAGVQRLKERQAAWAEWQRVEDIKKAEEARIAAYNEENGLVYIEPGTNPFLPPEPKPKQTP